MRALVTGSSGHLGEALTRTLRAAGHEVTGLDVTPSPCTSDVGSVADPDLVRRCMHGVDVVFHTATLHKPHVATHSRAAFVETNVAGTLCLLEAALDSGVSAFVYSSTTSVFGAAMNPAPDEPAVWVTEALAPVPKNIYGVTKRAAEDLCELFQRSRGLPCIVLRLSRFFPEEDDDATTRASFEDLNVKVNEFLNRRVEIADVVDAHLLAAERAPELGFDRVIVSATAPFSPAHLDRLRTDTAALVSELVPEHAAVYEQRGWHTANLDRVYVNRRAREVLGWRPRFDFREVVARLARGESAFSDLAGSIGRKGYHDREFESGPFPVEDG